VALVKLPELVEAWVCDGPPPRGRPCGTVLLTLSGKDFDWDCPVHKKPCDFRCLGEMPMPQAIIDAHREDLNP
jgi:hypothetical protein